jgi:hypothetical protein
MSFSVLRALARILAVTVPLIPCAARAGTAIGVAHSHDFNPRFDISANPVSTHPTYAFVDTGLVDSRGAHARAWASSTVTGGVLRQSTGGEGWYMNGGSPKHLNWHAGAGAGTYYLTAPQGVVSVPIQVVIRAAGGPGLMDLARPDVAPPQVGAYPSQGFFAEYNFDVHFGIESSSVVGPTGDLNLDGITNSADIAYVFDRVGQSGAGLLGDLNNDHVIDALDIGIVSQSAGSIGFETNQLLNGEARLGGPESGLPPISTSGDLTGRFTFVEEQSPNNGQVRYSASASESIISQIISLPVNVPFTLNFDQFMTYGLLDPNASDPPAVNVPNGLVAAVGGALVSEIRLPDVPGQVFSLRAVIDGLQGDANFDGIVDIKDLNIVRNNFGRSGPSFLGDTNGDGRVNLYDLNDVRNNFGATQAGVSTPEPGTFALAALTIAAGFAGLRKRRNG